MSKQFPVHLLIEPEPRSGAENMARDEALLEHAVAGGVPWMRWYQWVEPTLSLGYFQAADEPLPAELSGLPRVRRLSGGGAILHDQELTYSLVLPSAHPLTDEPSALYALIHTALIQVMRTAGLDVHLRGESFSKDVPEAYLCFSRGDANDVVCGPHKVLGSAQRRRRGAVLQHGSLIFRRSRCTPQYPGLFDLGPCVELATFQTNLAATAAAALGEIIVATEIPRESLTRANELQHRRYSHLDWKKSDVQ